MSTTSEVIGYEALPAGTEKHGAVILFHEWWGLNAHIQDLANRLAKEGFVVLALDLYGGKSTADGGEAAALATELDTLEAMRLTNLAATQLRAHPRSNGKLAVVGFCLGGAMALAAACHVEGLAAVAPFYGIPAKEKADFTKATAPIEAHFARTDAYATVAKAEAIAAQVNAQGGSMKVHVYEAEHAFMNDTRPVYDEASAKLAWSRLVAFFHAQMG